MLSSKSIARSLNGLLLISFFLFSFLFAISAVLREINSHYAAKTIATQPP